MEVAAAAGRDVEAPSWRPDAAGFAIFPALREPPRVSPPAAVGFAPPNVRPPAEADAG